MTILIQLILEGVAVEAHFQFTSVLGNLLDQIHSEGKGKYAVSGRCPEQKVNLRVEILLRSFDSCSLVPSAQMRRNLGFIRHVKSIPFVDVVQIL